MVGFGIVGIFCFYIFVYFIYIYTPTYNNIHIWNMQIYANTYEENYIVDVFAITYCITMFCRRLINKRNCFPEYRL